jgi:dolichyl-phosphate-mannose--protein O-mannosyl transferase
MTSADVPEDGSERPAHRFADAWFAPTPRNLAAWGVVVFLVSLAAFLWGIEAAPNLYFDETWYVPTARAWLKSGQMLHQEHPPLGKLLIAFGVWLFGDNPLGWRAMSALFGAITMVAMGLWSFALLGDLRRALWTSAITALDGIVFVQSRIAMLDIFLMAFGTAALAFYTLGAKEARSPGRARAYGIAMGVCLGLAGACKVSGFFLWFGLLAIQSLVGLLRLWRVKFDDPRESDFYAPEAAPIWRPLDLFVAFAAAPFLAYFLAYAPQMMHERTILEFVASHRRMADILSGHSPDHPYMSLWYTWPALWRPVWYLFLVEGGSVPAWSDAHPAAAVVGLANPIVVFAGEAAILAAVYRFLVRREREALIVAVAFFSQWLPWAVNPKGLEFSYYYFPSVLCLGPALALVLFRGRGRWRTVAALAFLVLVGASFAFFLPVLASGIGVGPDAFAKRVWLPTWR